MKTCQRGHSYDPRSHKQRGCPECRKMHCRAWRLRNLDEQRRREREQKQRQRLDPEFRKKESKAAIAWAKKHPEKKRAAIRKWSKTDKGKIAHSKAVKRYMEKHGDKVRAKNAVAKRVDRLVRHPYYRQYGRKRYRANADAIKAERRNYYHSNEKVREAAKARNKRNTLQGLSDGWAEIAGIQ